MQQNGAYRVAAGYPTELTSAQARFEMRNWDEVSLPAIMRGLAELDGGVGCVVFGNNAGQGLPLAQSLAPSLSASAPRLSTPRVFPSGAPTSSSATGHFSNGARQRHACSLSPKKPPCHCRSASSTQSSTTSTTITTHKHFDSAITQELGAEKNDWLGEWSLLQEQIYSQRHAPFAKPKLITRRSPPRRRSTTLALSFC